MRIKTLKRRSAIVLALATAGALAVAGVALAAGNSTVSFKFTPSNVPTNSFQAGQINVHTHTNYTGATQTDRARLFFDDDFRVNRAATPKCRVADITGDLTMKAAMNRCGSSLIGKGRAQATTGANTVNACVLVFNGKGAQGEILLFTRAQASPPFTINCQMPRNNTNGNASLLLKGDLKHPANVPGANDADFKDPNKCSGPQRKGCLLDFKNITSASPFPLTDFNVTVGKPRVPNAGNFISARCHDGNHRWNLRTKFDYVNPSSSQTVNASQVCS